MAVSKVVFGFLCGLLLLYGATLGVWRLAESLSIQLDVAGAKLSYNLTNRSSAFASSTEKPLVKGSPFWESLTAIPLDLSSEGSLPARSTGDSRTYPLVERLVSRGKALLSVKEVKVEGIYRLSREFVLDLALLNKRVWIWEPILGLFTTSLTESAWIDSAELSWASWPSVLKLHIKEAEPWLVSEFPDRSWLVSTRGRLLAPCDQLNDAELILEASELARLDGLSANPQALSALATVNGRFDYAMRMLRLLEMTEGVPFKVEKFTLLDDGSLLASPRQTAKYPQVRLAYSSLDEASDAMERLRSILQDLSGRGERAKTVDLRFKNQGIVE